MRPAIPKQEPSVRVLKFGGTCLHPADNREQAILRIAEERQGGHRVVAVVSAMGRAGDPYATDTLNALLPHQIPQADRERDALLCCGEAIASSLLAAELTAQGFPSVSLRGPQLGLITNGCFGNAEILSVDPGFMLDYLARGFVVVAAGFQGMSRDGSFTTLGRGGSDTAAVAIASALEADRVLFYKDVEGLFNADPKLVPAARPLRMIPYDEAAHLGSAGAKIINPQAADLAEHQGIPIEIRSLRGGAPGTLVASRQEIRKRRADVSGIFAVTCLKDIGRLKVVPGQTGARPEFPLKLFQSLAEAKISLDMINVLEDTAYFTVPSSETSHAAKIAEQAGCGAEIRANCAKVSLLGGGIHGVPGIMSRILSALSRVNVPVFQSVDTYTVISVLVEGCNAAPAAQALHRAFGLDQAPAASADE